MNTAIVIPARFDSKRFPGKPLHKIAGQSMLERVANVAKNAAKQLPNCEVYIATDDERIKHEADRIKVSAIMTDANCPSGSDRVLQAVEKLPVLPDFIVNLQGDAPCIPSSMIIDLVNAATADKDAQVITVALQLDWIALDNLREHKKTTPFSGTTVCLDKHAQALWFSKNIIPGIRNEQSLRETMQRSPVYQHIGIYGYAYPMLKTFVHLSQGHYEQLEGLEQLRLLENGYPIHVITPSLPPKTALIGVDTLEDALRLEALLSKHGELIQ